MGVAQSKPVCRLNGWLYLTQDLGPQNRARLPRPWTRLSGKVWPQLLGPRPQAWPLPSPGPDLLMGT